MNIEQGKYVLDLQKNKWKIFFGVTIIGFFLDWLTKYLAVSKLQMGIPLPVIGSVLQWQLIFNTGGLFGFNPKTWIPVFPLKVNDLKSNVNTGNNRYCFLLQQNGC